MTSGQNSHLPGRAQMRWRALLRYLAALERGDADALASTLRQAERDPALMELIQVANDAEADAFAVAPASADEIAHAQEALRARFPALTMPEALEPMKHDRLQTIERDKETETMNDYDTTPAFRQAEQTPSMAGMQPSTPSAGSILPGRPASPQRRPNRWLRLGQALMAALVVAALVGGLFTVLRHLGARSTSVPPFGTTTYIPARAHAVVAGSWIGEVWALDPATGKTYWKFSTGDGNPITAILIRNGIVLVGDTYDTPIKVFALRLSDGHLMWKHALAAGYGFPNYIYADNSAVSLYDSAGSYGFALLDGRPIWSVPNSIVIGAVNGITYLQGGGPFANINALLAINNLTGKRLWSRPLGNGVPQLLQVVGATAYFGIFANGQVGKPSLALNSNTGSVIATLPALPNFFTLLGATNSTVYGTVYIPGTGARLLSAYKLPTLARIWNEGQRGRDSVLYGQAVVDSNTLYLDYQSEYSLNLPPGGNTVGVTIKPTYHVKFTAFNGATGAERWEWHGPIIHVPYTGNTPTGVSYSGGYPITIFAGAQGRLFAATEQGVIAANVTGRPLWRFNAADDFVTLAAV